MLFLGLGILLLLLKAADINPVSQWAWGWVLSPFGLAAAWWAFSDAAGLTQRRAMRKMDKRKADRRARDMEALGLDHTRDKHVRAVRDAHRRANTTDTAAADRSRRDPKP